MQGGSTAKIFTLIAALQSGKINTKSTFPGNSPIYFKEFADPGAATSLGRQGGVVNFGNANEGTQNVCGATALSTNTIFARLSVIGTPQRAAEAAKTAGITTSYDANYANVFGTNNVKVLDMANAYATIAAQGKKATPYVVKSVTSADGTLQIKAKPKTTQVFDPDLMADVVDCMHQVTTHGTATYVGNSLGRPAAGKTGTTTGNYAAWFDGFTPQLATAVGIYKGDGSLKPENQMSNEPGVGELTGPTVPIWVWTAYMKAALNGAKVLDLPKPAHINPNAQYASTPTFAPRPTTSTSSAPPTSSAPTTTASPSPTDTATPTLTPSGTPSTIGHGKPGPSPT
jgi:membrane peptidoglycan carboxypeptidase